MKKRKAKINPFIASILFFLWLVCIPLDTNTHPISQSTPTREKRDGGSDDEDRGPPVFLLISECNIDNPGDGNNRKQFLEIVKTRNPFLETQPPIDKRSLDGYMLFVVEANPTRIVMSIDLGMLLPQHRRDYIVVASDNTVNGVDLLFRDVPTFYRDGMLPLTDGSVYGIILSYIPIASNRELLTLSVENDQYSSVSLSGEENMLRASVLMDSAVDMIVVGRKAPVNSCTFFDAIFPKISFPDGKRYLLRDIQSSSADEEDYTLNRCCEDDIPFDPSCWYIGRATPGRKNDCTGRPFILEKELERGIASFIGRNDDLDSMEVDTAEDSECSASYPDITAEVYAAVNDTEYVAAIQDALDSTECDRPVLSREPDLDPPVSSTLRLPYGVPTFQEFSMADFNACKKYLSNPDTLLTPSIKYWLDLKKTPESCRMYCRVCREYLRLGFRPDYKRKPNFVKDKGYFSPDHDTNTGAIKYHATTPFHKEAMEYYRKMKAASDREEVKKINNEQIEIEKKILTPTMNAIKLAFLQLKANVAFRSNKIFMDGVSELGVDLGSKARYSAGLRNMMTVLSDGMHEKLLHHLVQFGTYFTVMVDATTNSAITYDIVLIQTVEENRPVIYLWGLIPMTKHDGSKGMVDELVKRIKQDDKKVPGFERFFKEKCIALASDSASEMVGAYNSYHVHLKDYLGKDIPSIRCASHALHRVLAHALEIETKASTDPKKKPEMFFKTFGVSQNNFYTFYLSRGSKRWQRITDLARERGVIPYRLKKFFDLRWADSEHRCLLALYQNYDLLLDDLKSIASDPTFDKDGKQKASMLANTLSDKTYAITTAEFIDFLKVLKKMSVKFQEKAGLLVGNIDIVRKGYAKLTKRRTELGKNVTHFLSKCSCPEVCEVGKCTLVQYDECPSVMKGGRKYTETLNHGVKLSSYRDLIYQKLLQGMEQYFDFRLLEAFELFNNRLFHFECDKVIENGVISPPCSNLDNCYTEVQAISPKTLAEAPDLKMKKICTFYKYTDDECRLLLEDWKFALSGIVMNENCKQNKELDASLFWTATLNADEVPLTPLVNSLLVKILSTSWTSADAERGFSLVTHLKSPERWGLLPETLEQLVRLKFNGPDTLDSAKAYEYARKYVKIYSRTDDKQTSGGRPEDKDNKFYFKKSKIF